MLKQPNNLMGDLGISDLVIRWLGIEMLKSLGPLKVGLTPIFEDSFLFPLLPASNSGLLLKILAYVGILGNISQILPFACYFCLLYELPSGLRQQCSKSWLLNSMGGLYEPLLKGL